MKGHDFQGVNAAYVAELFDRYREDPASVDAATRAEFDAGLIPEAAVAAAPGGIVDSADVAEVVGTVNLAECIRRYGHLAATLDPLGAAPDRRSVAGDAVPRPLGRDAGAAAGQPGRRPGRRRAPPTPSRRSTRCAASTARPPATTTTTCSCRKSATGCGTPSSPAASVRRCCRSTTSSCSIA